MDVETSYGWGFTEKIFGYGELFYLSLSFFIFLFFCPM
jgi:hypothetical protein